MTMFQGQRAFHTQDPGQLRTELLRQNVELEREFTRVEAEKESRWNVRRATGATVQASHGDMVVAGHNQNTVVLLPRSDPARAGRSVRVVQVGGLGAVSVAAASRETVNNVASVAVGVAAGFRDYVDEGNGHWWGPA